MIKEDVINKELIDSSIIIQKIVKFKGWIDSLIMIEIHLDKQDKFKI